MKFQFSRRRLLGTCALGVAALVCSTSVGQSRPPKQGVSSLSVTVFKLPGNPAKPVDGAIIEIMNKNDTPRGFSCMTDAQGKCTIKNIPASSDGSLAYYIRITYGGQSVNHKYRNGLFPNNPGAWYKQRIFVP